LRECVRAIVRDLSETHSEQNCEKIE
jgi:hypothetical protein